MAGDANAYPFNSGYRLHKLLADGVGLPVGGPTFLPVIVSKDLVFSFLLALFCVFNRNNATVACQPEPWSTPQFQDDGNTSGGRLENNTSIGSMYLNFGISGKRTINENPKIQKIKK